MKQKPVSQYIAKVREITTEWLQTIFFVQIYNNTQRSILAVLVFHGMMNFTGELLGINPEMYPFLLSGYALLAVLLILHWKH